MRRSIAGHSSTISRSLKTLEQASEKVRWLTLRQFRTFDRRPADYHDSREYFRTLCLITILQRDCGIRYNFSVIDESVPFTPAESFIHGALIGEGGSCATMPVVYAAVGRSLGYPIKLVSAKGARFTHLFARWDEEKKSGPMRFNIEATSQGLSCHHDEYYRTGRYLISEEHERRGRFLVSKTPREELAGFLMERGWCFHELKNWRGNAEAFAWASGLAPDNDFYRNTLISTVNEWKRELRQRMPPRFPALRLQSPFRRFPKDLPLEIEQEIFGSEAMDNLLNDRQLDRQWWQPMRLEHAGEWPREAFVDFQEQGGCRIRFRGQSKAGEMIHV